MWVSNWLVPMPAVWKYMALVEQYGSMLWMPNRRHKKREEDARVREWPVERCREARLAGYENRLDPPVENSQRNRERRSSGLTPEILVQLSLSKTKIRYLWKGIGPLQMAWLQFDDTFFVIGPSMWRMRIDDNFSMIGRYRCKCIAEPTKYWPSVTNQSEI